MIYHTENPTTVRYGESIATVIADSVSERGERITTLELVYPRYIHSELLTHRAFSRNASSSRATPVSLNIEEVMKDPVGFDSLNVNQPGMEGGGHLEAEDAESFAKEWRDLGAVVASHVRAWSEKYNLHKQVLNRALEPWLRIRTLVTATDFSNFFNLRISHAAQPEMQFLATAIYRAMLQSKPVLRAWHLPYITPEEEDYCIEAKRKISAARCARVSYARHDGKTPSVDEDFKLAQRLLTDMHLSPFEHQAVVESGVHANFTGWRSARNLMGV